MLRNGTLCILQTQTKYQWKRIRPGFYVSRKQFCFIIFLYNMNFNPVGRFEIYVTDMNRAKAFYEGVFQK